MNLLTPKNLMTLGKSGLTPAPSGNDYARPMKNLLRCAPQDLHRRRPLARVCHSSCAPGAFVRAAPVSFIPLHSIFPPQAIRSVPCLPRSLRSLGRSGHSTTCFRWPFHAAVFRPPAASFLSATRKPPAAYLFDFASATLRHNNQGRPAGSCTPASYRRPLPRSTAGGMAEGWRWNKQPRR
jgi:hypothetical protein